MARGLSFGSIILMLALALAGESCFAYSLENTEFKGDLRLRYQYDHKTAAGSSTQRHRGRMRLRFGLETALNDRVVIGLRLATGQADNRSTNQTLGGFFVTKDIRLDMGYAAWEPTEELGFRFGKYNDAFLTAGDLIWDSDINFEGASVLWAQAPAAGLSGLINAGFFILNEDKSGSRDAHMFYIQPGLGFTRGVMLKGRIGIAYYDFEHVKGSVPDEDLSAGTNTRQEGRLKYGYDSLNPNFYLTYAAGAVHALTLLGDYIYNFDSEDSGFLVGVRMGYPGVGNKGSWNTCYNFRRLGRDAFMDVFPDSDFYGGATGVAGHEFIFQYAAENGIIVGLDYYRAERIEGEKAPLFTVQLDCVFKF
jgi:hypothetical protein